MKYIEQTFLTSLPDSEEPDIELITLGNSKFEQQGSETLWLLEKLVDTYLVNCYY